MPNPVTRVIDWLRAGYPEGVPSTDYIPLLALLRRQLSDDEVRLVARTVTQSDGSSSGPAEGGAEPISETDIATLITKVTNEMPHPEDVERVTSRLVAGGWPLADPHAD